MKTRIATAILFALAANCAFANDGYWKNIENGFDKMIYVQKDNAEYWAGVDASFDNMLNHAPYAGPTEVKVARGVKDPVELALHAPTPDAAGSPERGRDTYFANVDASFDNMLNHAPYAGPSAAVVRTGNDPLEAAIHAMLRNDGGRVHYAQGYEDARN